MDTSRNLFCGMRQKARGVQQQRHIKWIGENASTVQRSDVPAKWIYGGVL